MTEIRLETRTLLERFDDGDSIGWGAEFRLLRSRHASRLCDIGQTAKLVGILKPVLLGPDGRVWDGHHRLCVAHDLSIETVPVEYVRVEYFPVDAYEQVNPYRTDGIEKGEALGSLDEAGVQAIRDLAEWIDVAGEDGATAQQWAGWIRRYADRKERKVASDE